MNTDRYGKTYIPAIEVISLDTRITRAFAKKGVVPNPTYRSRATELIKVYPTLTASQAVKIVLEGGRSLSSLDADFFAKY